MAIDRECADGDRARVSQGRPCGRDDAAPAVVHQYDGRRTGTSLLAVRSMTDPDLRAALVALYRSDAPMKVPSVADRAVKVRAYLTDETFGYTHWRAAQFSAPAHDKYGLLLLFDTEAERDAALVTRAGEPDEKEVMPNDDKSTMHMSGLLQRDKSPILPSASVTAGDQHPAKNTEAEGEVARRLGALIVKWRESVRKLRLNSKDTVVETLIAQRADAFAECADELAQALTAPPAGAPPSLFQQGAHTLRSGEPSAWKIECDALTDADIETLALMLVERLPTFGAVEGVARGGERLAQALRHCPARYYAADRPVLIVDDVLTTGASLEQQRAGREAIGAVLFARGPCPSWVTPLFQMPLRAGAW
jgi:hypothetical protein